MVDATARYVISADDKSKAAVASIKRGFQDMDKGVRTTIRSLNLALGIFVGVQLKQAFRKVLDATAESERGQRGFAQALNDVRASARDLLSAKSGLPGATASMKELAETLKDPSVVAAADKLTSTMIKGFSNTLNLIGKIAGGIREITKESTIASAKTKQDVVDVLDSQISQLEGRIKRERSGARGYIKGEPSFGLSSNDELDRMKEQLNKLRETEQRILDYQPSGGPGKRPIVSKDSFDRILEVEKKRIEELNSLTETSSEKEIKAYKDKIDAINELSLRGSISQMQSAERSAAALDEFLGSRKREAEIEADVGRLFKESSDDLNDAIEKRNKSIAESFDIADEQADNIKKFYREMDDSTQTSLERQARSIEEFKTELNLLVLNGLDPEIAKRRLAEFSKSFDTLGVYADQAARNMEDAFADFFFDPFEDGLKGMLKSFIDTIRRMVAEQAAAKLFSSKSQGGLGLGDIISGGLDALFGGGKLKATQPIGPPLASGTNFVPGDNFPALLHRGEAVVPAKYNPAAGGASGGVVINNHIDARGATPDAIAMLPEVLRRNNDQLEAKIIDGLRRRRYAFA